MQTEIVKMSEEKLESCALMKAAQIIRTGGLVIFPTETVYGLGGDATNPEAARRIYSAKGRPSDNPLIIHLADPKDAEKYTVTTPAYYTLAERFMPGPITVVMRSLDSIPRETRGGLDTVAVRCPSNKIARALISYSGVPIAAPSTNLSGSPSPTNAAHVIDDMLGRVDMIIDGGFCDIGLESTIVSVDADGGLTLLRPGKITVEQLNEVFPKVRIADAVTDRLKDGAVALSPGMKYRHYAPRADLVLLDGEISSVTEYINSSENKRVAVICYDNDEEEYKARLSFADIYPFGDRSDEAGQARVLFSLLRDIDKKSYAIIYAPLPSKQGMGLALYNRMIRAAAHKIIKL